MSVAEVLRAREGEGEGAEGGAGEADRGAVQGQADHGEYISTCLTLSFLSPPENHLQYFMSLRPWLTRVFPDTYKYCCHQLKVPSHQIRSA